METYFGYVRSWEDAMKLFEACRIGLLPRVQRRLSEKEKQSIKPGSVFIWDQRETGIHNWKDGKLWRRISGSFVTYQEVTAGYEDTNLVKQSIVFTTDAEQLHLISYCTQSQLSSPNLLQPTTDPMLHRVVLDKEKYPQPTNKNIKKAPIQQPQPEQLPQGQLYNTTHSMISDLPTPEEETPVHCSSKRTTLSTKKSSRTAIPSAVERRSRPVLTACRRCQIKKLRCDRGIPCGRCKFYGEVCTQRRKQTEFSMSDAQQYALIATVQKLYTMVRNNEPWLFGEPELNDRSLPVVHDIAEKLGCIRPLSDSLYELTEQQQSLFANGLNVAPNNGSESKSSEDNRLVFAQNDCASSTANHSAYDDDFSIYLDLGQLEQEQQLIPWHLQLYEEQSVQEQQLTHEPQLEQQQLMNMAQIAFTKSVGLCLNIEFKHDGITFTSPACMEGVPVRKITEEDEYWEKNWRPDKRPSSKKALLPIHPNQLLAKKHLGGRGFSAYYLRPFEEIFETLQHAGYTSDEAVQWLRYRLAELQISQGNSFKLMKALFYLCRDDEEYKSLLQKNSNLCQTETITPTSR